MKLLCDTGIAVSLIRIGDNQSKYLMPTGKNIVRLLLFGVFPSKLNFSSPHFQNGFLLWMDGLIISPCTSYVYLESPFTSDGSASSAIRLHARGKVCHVLRFVSFVKKNNDVPFVMKLGVFDAALMSSLLYGWEPTSSLSLNFIIGPLNKTAFGCEKHYPK